MKKIYLFLWCFGCLTNGIARKVDSTFFNWQPIQFYNWTQLDSIRKMVGDEMVFNAFRASLKTHKTFNWSNERELQQYMAQAESFFHAQPMLQKSIGDEMLTVLADTLQTAIRDETVDANAPIIATVVKQLANNKKYIDIKMSNLRKTWNYLKAGRFDYVFFKMTTTYKSVSLWGLLAGFFGIALFKFRKKIVGVFTSKKETESPLEKAAVSQNALITPLILVLSTMLFQESCAQKPVPLCELLILEKRIDETEQLIQQQVKAIPVELQLELPVSVYPHFQSVWQTYEKITKPSEILAMNASPCDNQTLEPYVKQGLSSRLQQAKANMAAVQKVQKKAIGVPATDEQSFSQQKDTGDPAVRSGNGKYTIPKPSSNEQVKLVSITEDNEVLETDKNGSVKHSMSLNYVNNENDFACFIVNPHSTKVKIDFLWKDPAGQPLKNFERSIELLKKQHKKPIMLMNAGIFGDNNTPLGSFWSNGKIFRSFNDKPGTGNFYMNPAGIFIIDKKGIATVQTKSDYLENSQDSVATLIKHATQSGPMLVIHGKIHPMFNANSNNLHIRNGVGVMADGNIVFVMSKQPVTFYEFAEVFRTRFKCQNALYLDGAISQMYVPKLNMIHTGGNFAGIIAVSEE